MDYLEVYRNRFNIKWEAAQEAALLKTENGARTACKEMIGDAVIKQYHLFDKLFPDNIGYKKVTNKDLQLAGADYEVYVNENTTTYIDLKSCVGPDYSMKPEDFDMVEATDELLARDGIPIEIYQNGEFTNSKCKITSFMLYVICDVKGVRYCLVPYNEIRNFSLRHKDAYIIDKENNIAHLEKHYPFTRYTSNNGSGIYAKKPVFTYEL